MAYIKTRSYPDLKHWRAAQGLNQRDAADFLRLSHAVYARLERGARYLKGERAKRVMVMTHVPLEQIVGVL